jgi:hypothetical protein
LRCEFFAGIINSWFFYTLVSHHHMRSAISKVALALVVLGVAVVLLWSYMASRQPPSVKLDDLTRSSEIVLKAPNGETAIVGLEVIGSGQVDGNARVELMLDGRVQEAALLQGPVEFRWSGDWYSPEALVRYTPGSATSGSVKLSYRFASL